jgi:hypothetical protein
MSLLQSTKIQILQNFDSDDEYEQLFFVGQAAITLQKHQQK